MGCCSPNTLCLARAAAGRHIPGAHPCALFAPPCCWCTQLNWLCLLLQVPAGCRHQREGAAELPHRSIPGHQGPDCGRSMSRAGAAPGPLCVLCGSFLHASGMQPKGQKTGSVVSMLHWEMQISLKPSRLLQSSFVSSPYHNGRKEHVEPPPHACIPLHIAPGSGFSPHCSPQHKGKNSKYDPADLVELSTA